MKLDGGIVLGATLLLAVSCGSGEGQTKASAPKPASYFAVANFSLVPPGILFELHPTDRPILIRASSPTPLKVCQFGTSFAGAWTGGCRTLSGRPLFLPASSGAVHVAFRITTTTAGTTRVARLALSWHCVDHQFGLLRGRTLTPAGHPTFDC
jgi:hypothetical protein